MRSQLGQLRRAGGGDPEALLRAVVAVAVGLDQPVALQPLQRRVHLADVQRPHLAGPRLELLAAAAARTSAPRSAARAARAGRSCDHPIE